MSKLVRTEHGPLKVSDCIYLKDVNAVNVEKAIERSVGLFNAYKTKVRLKKMVENKEMNINKKKFA